MNLAPTRPFPGSSRVVPTLARFVINQALPRAVVIDGNPTRGSQLAGFLVTLGYDSELELTGRQGFLAAAEAADVELILVSFDLFTDGWAAYRHPGQSRGRLTHRGDSGFRLRPARPVDQAAQPARMTTLASGSWSQPMDADLLKTAASRDCRPPSASRSAPAMPARRPRSWPGSPPSAKAHWRPT